MIDVLNALIGPVQQGTVSASYDRFAADSTVFDDDHLVSFAGLVPVMTLAT
jgi:hypothetical protein